MTHFAFSFGLERAENARLRATCKTIWGEVQTITVEDFSIYLPSSTSANFVETIHGMGVVSGYAALSPTPSTDPLKRDEQRLIDTILNKREWPLGSDWSGAFCAVAFSRSDRNLILFNDTIGCFPLYYTSSSGSVWGSTSLITMGRFRASSIDLTGLSQRLSGKFCNYGRRTILKNVQRLLPGELISFAAPSASGKSIFDNTLYSKIIDGDVREIAEIVWDLFKDEVARVIAGNNPVFLAMSGGWDSRLLLGAIRNSSRSIQCYTYGDCDSYESLIAKRCAAISGAEYECLSAVGKYIPHRNQIEPFVVASENTGYHVLLPLLECSAQLSGRPLLLLGDLFESIDGRNMGELTSRTGRKRSFLRGLVGLRDELQVITPEAVATWRQKITKERLSITLDGLSLISPALMSKSTREQVIGETSADLDLSLERVFSHNLTFLPTAHELFQWFHYVRYPAVSQLLFLNARWNCVSPPMSMRFVRFISRIHPMLKLRRRLMRAMSRLPELEDLASIPSAQIPWLGSKAPGFVQDLIWGLRSESDQILIKRSLRAKNPAMRRRVIRTHDLVAEYRSPKAIDHVGSWFSGRWVNRDEIIQIAKNRAALASWPLVTIDIGSLANVSMILDLCYPE